MEQMHDLAFGRTKDGDIRLEQSTNGERDVIVLSPWQLRHVACRAAGLDENAAAEVADRERKLSVLTAGIERFVCDSSIRGEILDHCGDGLELIARLDALLNLAWEYDGERLLPEDLNPPSKPVYGDIPHTPATDISNDKAAGVQLGLEV